MVWIHIKLISVNYELGHRVGRQQQINSKQCAKHGTELSRVVLQFWGNLILYSSDRSPSLEYEPSVNSERVGVNPVERIHNCN